MQEIEAPISTWDENFDFIQEIEKTGLNKFEYLRVTAEKNYPNNEATITWGGLPVASPGNITGISAPPKGGKTAVTCVLQAGAISQNGNIEGFSDLKVISNPSGKAVIGMDTEQTEYDQQYNVKTTLKRAGLKHTPDYFLCYNISQLSISDYAEVTSYICDSADTQFGGIHSIYIDGGADYIKSANDEEKSVDIINYFRCLAVKHKCPVIIVVHTNPNSEKERGHFGSILQRKCYGILTIEVRDGVSILKGKSSRKAGELEPICFKYDAEKGYHTEVATPDKDVSASKKTIEKIRKILTTSLPLPNRFKHNEAVKRIMKEGNISSDRTAKNYITTGVAHDILIHEDEKYYLNHGGVIQGNSG